MNLDEKGSGDGESNGYNRGREESRRRESRGREDRRSQELELEEGLAEKNLSMKWKNTLTSVSAVEKMR